MDATSTSMSDFPDRIRKICLSPSASILETMKTIQDGAIEIALVVEPDMKVLGTVTDGDIRRALLSGASLSDSISAYMRTNFTWVAPTTGRAEVLDILRSRVLRHLPVLDGDGRLVGLHLLREMLGAVPRNNWAVIMAGGRGERLRPYTDALPKPMIKIAGRPILERIVLHLVGFGIRKIFLSIHYMGHVIENHFGDGSNFGCEICYLRETKPLGTGGALSLLPERPSEPLIVLNGDLVTQFDVGSLLAFHSSGGFSVSVGVHQYVHTVPFGVVETDSSQIKSVSEKPTHSWQVNAGIYVLNPGMLELIPPDTYYPLPALIEESLTRGDPVGAFQIRDEWQDIGRPDELRRACGRM